MKHQNGRILIVDDDVANLATLEAYLVTLGFASQKAKSGFEALEKVRQSLPDLILLDLIMPGIDGFEVCRRLKSDPATYKIGIVAITALLDRKSNLKAIEAGVDGFLTKPIDEVVLKTHINSLLRMKRLDSELEASRSRLDTIREYHRRLSPGRSRTREIIGESPLIEGVRAMINMVKDSKIPVLILGESGTGKQLAAEALHWEGRRASEPFVQINCAGLQENLLESELFGYAKGAFTGAVINKKGLIEVAEGGTLFVDEIADMALAVEAKLLDVLDSGLFRRLGETVERKANVRIIAATNRELKKEIEKGLFRSDLFYRLNVFEIEMPPLRKRKEDIARLAEYFLACSRLATISKKTFSSDALKALLEYDWPGNVRELSNVVERAIVFSGQDSEISPKHLSPELIRPGGAVTRNAYQASSGMTLAEAELAYIKEVLEKEHGNRTRTARILGISRSTLKKKISDNPSLQKL
ncbi:MAG: sigma-54-dependent Fis family transcriptional regulator [Desulfobacterales bacterium]|nr:sigma-54-dependent Fis family transcriptional regulator [Desulfobacterales bacterium]